VKVPAVKVLEPEFTADPNLWLSSVNGQNRAHLKIIARTEYMDAIAIQNRDLVVGIAEPNAAEDISEGNHHRPLGQFSALGIGCPSSVNKPVEAVTAEGYPETSFLILRYRV
jgi:hypothetical protein